MSTYLIGNDRIKAAAQTAALSGRGMRVIVVEGPDGSGKHTIARFLSSTFLCEADHPPCLQCRHCHLVEEGIHPDVVIPERDKKKVLSVNAIKALRRDAYVRPHIAKEKVYIFEDSEALNAEGQNALLKLLEEPPSNVRFILLCKSRDQLLPTVLSRSSLFSTEPLTSKELTAFLHREKPDKNQYELASAVAGSGGYAGQALTLLTSGDTLQKTAQEYISVAVKGDEFALFCKGESIAADVDLPLFLSALQSELCCQARLLAGTNPEKSLIPDREMLYALLSLVRSLFDWPDLNLSSSVVFSALSTGIASICMEK